MADNFCAFWADGCLLPHDCRSFSCTKYFCDKLKKELDMKVILEHLQLLDSLMQDFSIKKFLGLET